MAKYAVFAFRDYYPSGGWDDCVGTADTHDDIQRLLEDDVRSGYHHENYQIVVIENSEPIVLRFSFGEKFSWKRKLLELEALRDIP